jgi:hypothetical protein
MVSSRLLRSRREVMPHKAEGPDNGHDSRLPHGYPSSLHHLCDLIRVQESPRKYRDEEIRSNDLNSLDPKGQERQAAIGSDM